MIRINIFESDLDLSSYKIFWHNFLLYVIENNYNKGIINAIRNILHEEYNAKINYDCLEFKNQDDATMFILTWS